MKKPLIILVLYYTRGVYPLRDTIRTHLYCWQRYSKYRFIYVNVAFGFPWNLLRRVRIAGVIYHTIFLGMRWTPSLFRQQTAHCASLADLDVPKIAMPQDEFIHTDMLAEFLATQRITHLYTCAEELDWRNIYGRFVDFSRVKVKTVLTGYLDDATVARIGRLKQDGEQRNRDIGYRAWKAAYWLGEHGQHKVRVADVLGEAAKRRGLRVDSSMRNEDVLSGDEWFRFMLDCRATIGVEGGASVLDRDGSVKTTVEAYERAHPGAGFEEVRDACFPGRDGEIKLACISPRHLEACITETCQILIKGQYNGILRPWEHYIPVRKDYSNLDEALDALADSGLVSRMVKKAYEEVVESGRWSYRTFVRETEKEIFDPQILPRLDLQSWLIYLAFRLRDWLHWRLIQAEVARSGLQPRSRLSKIAYGQALVVVGAVMQRLTPPEIARALAGEPSGVPLASGEPQRPRVCLLACSSIADDPRVRRQGNALYDAGWTVIGVGLPGGGDSSPPWPVMTSGSAASSRIYRVMEALARHPSLFLVRKALALTRRVVCGVRSVVRAVRIYFRPSHALQVYLSWPTTQSLYATARHLKADIWLANDWTTLPLAARLAKENGGVYVYDTHELAVEEYAESLKWRLLFKPIAQSVERQYIVGAARVSAVSSGIADKLTALYNLPRKPLVIRNVPVFHQAAFRPTGTPIRVLYHGIIAPQRGLEATLESIHLWRPEFTLTIRGMGNPAYLASLRRRIAALRLDQRVTLEPPVPMTELVRAAMAFDVGLFALPGHSQHNVYALPNKFFEYIMAGLALCVSDLPEMAGLVAQYDLGTTIPSVKVEQIASAINSLDPARIDACKRNALATAKELCWEQESSKMLEAYKPLVAKQALTA